MISPYRKLMERSSCDELSLPNKSCQLKKNGNSDFSKQSPWRCLKIMLASQHRISLSCRVGGGILTLTSTVKEKPEYLYVQAMMTLQFQPLRNLRPLKDPNRQQAYAVVTIIFFQAKASAFIEHTKASSIEPDLIHTLRLREAPRRLQPCGLWPANKGKEKEEKRVCL